MDLTSVHHTDDIKSTEAVSRKPPFRRHVCLTVSSTASPRLPASEPPRGPAARSVSRFPFLRGKRVAVCSPFYEEADAVTCVLLFRRHSCLIRVPYPSDRAPKEVVHVGPAQAASQTLRPVSPTPKGLRASHPPTSSGWPAAPLRAHHPRCCRFPKITGPPASGQRHVWLAEHTRDRSTPGLACSNHGLVRFRAGAGRANVGGGLEEKSRNGPGGGGLTVGTVHTEGDRAP